jgi:hypothetical protein
VRLLGLLSLTLTTASCQPKSAAYPELLAAEVACNRAYDNAIDSGRCDEHLDDLADCPAYQQAAAHCRALFDAAEVAR